MRTIEAELMHRIDPDKTLIIEAKRAAVHFVRRRIPDFTKQGGRYRRASFPAAAWFFQQPIKAGHRLFFPRADGRVEISNDPNDVREGWEW